MILVILKMMPMMVIMVMLMTAVEFVKSSTRIHERLSNFHLRMHMFDRNYTFPRDSVMYTYFKYLALHNDALKYQSIVPFSDLAGVANGVVK